RKPVLHPYPKDRKMEFVTFTPDGSAALLGYLDGTVRLMNATTGKVLWESRVEEGCLTAAAFRPDGQVMLIGYGQTNRPPAEQRGKPHPRAMATGNPLGLPLVHPDGLVHAAAFSPDGKTFVTECGVWTDEKRKGVARFWDAGGNEVCEPLEHSSLALTVAF